MNFLKFQYVTAFLSIALLLSGCVVDPYYGRNDSYGENPSGPYHPYSMRAMGVPSGPESMRMYATAVPSGPSYSMPSYPQGPKFTSLGTNSSVYIPSGPSNATGYHIVQRGETLYRISRRYGLNYRNIAAWNNIRPPYTIWPGQQLLIHAPSGMGIQSVSPPCR